MSKNLATISGKSRPRIIRYDDRLSEYIEVQWGLEAPHNTIRQSWTKEFDLGRQRIDGKVYVDLDKIDAVCAAKIAGAVRIDRETDPTHQGDATGTRSHSAGEIHVGQVGRYRYPHLPLMVLDGTAEPKLAEAFYGPLAHHCFKVERNAIVTQVLDPTFSKTGLVDGAGRLRRQARRFIAGMERKGVKVAVFSNKSVRDALGLAESEDAGHFGYLRGKNTWEFHDCVVIVGREEASPFALEILGRAYASAARGRYRDGAGMVLRWRGIRMKDGTRRPVRVRVHEDPWADLCLQAMREREVEQAMDRVRLIFNDEPKPVYILSSLELDVAVDEIVEWSDLVPDRVGAAMRKHGFVPVSGSEAVRVMPEIWKWDATARSDLTEFARHEAVRTMRIRTADDRFLDLYVGHGEGIGAIYPGFMFVPTTPSDVPVGWEGVGPRGWDALACFGFLPVSSHAAAAMMPEFFPTRDAAKWEGLDTLQQHSGDAVRVAANHYSPPWPWMRADRAPKRSVSVVSLGTTEELLMRLKRSGWKAVVS